MIEMKSAESEKGRLQNNVINTDHFPLDSQERYRKNRAITTIMTP